MRCTNCSLEIKHGQGMTDVWVHINGFTSCLFALEDMGLPSGNLSIKDRATANTADTWIQDTPKWKTNSQGEQEPLYTGIAITRKPITTIQLPEVFGRKFRRR